ncbi:MAG: c-type cytochrome [Flavobacteriaceae bacterium]|nr:c-type cytochrome [Flavobacteriaceae bacterium]
MKKILYLSTITVFVAFVTLISLTGCKDSDKTNKDKMQNMKGMKNRGHDDDHTHKGQDKMTNHMKHMDDVRDWLKEELGDDYDKPIKEATGAQIAFGKSIYDKTCFTCHGTTGKGDGMAAAALNPKPADFTDPEHSSYYSDSGRLYIIKNGIKDSPMVGWGSSLSEKEILAVYAYVKSLRAKTTAVQTDAKGMYVCPMHPNETGNKGDVCPKCGMTMVMNKKMIKKDHNADGHTH